MLASATLGSSAFGQQAFYVKQEKPQTPGETLKVGVQGLGAPWVAFTVFRVKRPAEFIAAQADIHRLSVEDTPMRDALNLAIQRSGAKDKPPVWGTATRVKAGSAGDNFEYVAWLTETLKAVKAAEGTPAPYDEIDLGVKAPGLYLVEARWNNQIAYCLTSITQLAVMTRSSERGVLVYVVDRGTGLPVSGAAVRVYRRGRILAQGTSGKDGVFMAATGYLPRVVVTAQSGEQFTACDPTYFPARVRARRCFVFTERPLYLPGEKVYFKGVLRDFDGTKHSVPAGPGGEWTATFRATDGRKGEIAKGAGPIDKTAGAFSGSFDIGEAAGLGECALEVTVDGRTYRGEFKVEQFQKPEYVVRVTASKPAAVMRDQVTFDIAAQYYFGGEVAAGQVEWQLYRSRFDQPLFEDTGLEGFYSQGEFQSFKPELIKSGKGALDKAGKLSVPVGADVQPNNYFLRLAVTVVDSSRRRASGSGSVKVARAAFQLDVKTNKSLFTVEEWANVTVKAADLAPRPVETDFEIAVIQRGRKYPRGGSASWLHRELAAQPDVPDRLLFTKKGRTDAKGEAALRLSMPAAGEIELRVSAKDARGNAVGASRSVWVAKGQTPISFSGDFVQIVPDKKAYAVGDVAKVLVVTPMPGVAPLVVIEGGRVLHDTTQLKANANVIAVPITEDMAPNAHISVSAVWKNGLVESEQTLVVPPVKKVLRVAVTFDRAFYRPREKGVATIKVTDHAGRPVETDLAVAVVDDSLYALQADTNARLRDFFYALRRRNVASGSSIEILSYDYARVAKRLPTLKIVKDLFKGKKAEVAPTTGAVRAEEAEARPSPRPAAPPREAMRAAPRNGGGRTADLSMAAAEPATREAEEEVRDDEADKKPAGKAQEKAGPATAERTLFKTTALWRAFVRTDAKGLARVEVPFPDNLTTWRLTVRAIDPETRVGETTQETVTKKLLVARASLPAFLVAGDEAVAPLIAHNFGPKGADVAMALEASAGLVIAGAKAETKRIEPNGKATLNVQVKAERSGPAEVKATVKAGADEDVLVSRLPVNAHGILKAVGEAGELTQAKTTLSAETLSLPAGVRLDEARLTLHITPGYFEAIRTALPTMIEYPYGCTEQTLSKFVPNLVAQRAFKTLLGKTFVDEAALAKNIEGGLARLASLQQPDGGWGWWRENGSDPFMTAYAVCGLAEAKAQGAAVDARTWKAGVARLTGTLKQKLDYPTRAYVLYALSTAGALKPAELEKHFDQRDRTQADPYTVSLLLLAYDRLKRPAEVKVLAKQLEAAAVERGNAVYWGDQRARRWSRDDIETTAMAVRALIAADPKHPMIESGLRHLMNQRVGAAWRSTRDSAAVVRAMCDFLLARRITDQKSVAVTVTVNGKAQRILAGGADGQLSTTFSGPELRHGANTVVIEAPKPAGLFYSAHLSYFTSERPIAAADAGFKVERSYAVLVQEKRGAEMVWRPTALKGVVPADALVLVTVTVTTPEARDFVMVVDRPPAAHEPVRRDRGYRIEGVRDLARDVHREFHFDHVAFFVSRMPAGTQRFHYLFRPTLSGRFSALPATAELMYYPEVRGNSAEARLEF